MSAAEKALLKKQKEKAREMEKKKEEERLKKEQGKGNDEKDGKKEAKAEKPTGKEKKFVDPMSMLGDKSEVVENMEDIMRKLIENVESITVDDVGRFFEAVGFRGFDAKAVWKTIVNLHNAGRPVIGAINTMLTYYVANGPKLARVNQITNREVVRMSISILDLKEERRAAPHVVTVQRLVAIFPVQTMKLRAHYGKVSAQIYLRYKKNKKVYSFKHPVFCSPEGAYIARTPKLWEAWVAWAKVHHKQINQKNPNVVFNESIPLARRDQVINSAFLDQMLAEVAELNDAEAFLGAGFSATQPGAKKPEKQSSEKSKPKPKKEEPKEEEPEESWETDEEGDEEEEEEEEGKESS